MSRRSKSKRVLAQPDPIYNSRLVNLLVIRVLKSGKKSVAQKIVYTALEIIAEKTNENPILSNWFLYPGITFPSLSVIEIIVLLKVAFTNAFPLITTFFSFFFALNLLFFFESAFLESAFFGSFLPESDFF